uniref:Uncharacterized protein n=1 Tax=Ixodes ricinus TaxID=34613 RepID=A0A147BEX0_IXORI
MQLLQFRIVGTTLDALSIVTPPAQGGGCGTISPTIMLHSTRWTQILPFNFHVIFPGGQRQSYIASGSVSLIHSPSFTASGKPEHRSVQRVNVMKQLLIYCATAKFMTRKEKTSRARCCN